jgi:hypothetical protein
MAARGFENTLPGRSLRQILPALQLAKETVSLWALAHPASWGIIFEASLPNHVWQMAGLLQKLKLSFVQPV